MAALPLIVFDVNETLLDLQTMEPIFERIFGEKQAMRLWFANFIMYSAALTVAGCMLIAWARNPIEHRRDKAHGALFIAANLGSRHAGGPAPSSASMWRANPAEFKKRLPKMERRGMATLMPEQPPLLSDSANRLDAVFRSAISGAVRSK